ncbi:MAG: CubicO group peptidase (beta-lactamase class C family) [Bradymonadia bacterium]|jgi:CubicO group peptidase (beta-lactamase class C family)
MNRMICCVVAAALLSCTVSEDAPVAAPATGEFDRQMQALRVRFKLTSIAAVVVNNGAVVVSDAWGTANVDAGEAADSATIYSLASCSKPFVGLALAALLEEQPDIDLDADINDILDWDAPVTHPQFADTPLTLRHLVEHRSGIVADGDADYDTYPKPDPDQSLSVFLQALLATDAAWLPTEPGAAYEYSNLGVALAALIIEEASGEDFRAFTKSRLFDPIGMADTRWFYGDLSASQRARHAIPYDDEGFAYEIYGFNDYPSGLLRSTADDMGKFLIAMTSQGGGALSAGSVSSFEDTPLLIEAGMEGPDRVFDHSGSESGVSTYFMYGDDGVGFAWMINTDIADADDEALSGELTKMLRAEASRER